MVFIVHPHTQKIRRRNNQIDTNMQLIFPMEIEFLFECGKCSTFAKIVSILIKGKLLWRYIRAEINKGL